MDDEFVFANEAESDGPKNPPAANDTPWKVLIVDDDEGVHTSTRFALERVSVDGRPVEIIDAYSADEAKQHLEAHQDIALALVDVVMESEHAGLDLVKWVREEKKDSAIRLVLRTGQPGQAPERQVVVNFDIDDYKTKSELTSQKLFTLLHASLRSYRHIRALERNLRGLRLIIEAANALCRAESVGEFATGVLEQATALLNLGDESVLCHTDGIAACSVRADLSVVAATGRFSPLVGTNPYQTLPSEIQALFAEAFAARTTLFRGNLCAAYVEGRHNHVALLYFQASRNFADEEKPLIQLFARNIGSAFCNWRLCRDCRGCEPDETTG